MIYQTDTFSPGKVILTGEHAVVYGKQALAVSIGLGVRVRVKRAKKVVQQNTLLRKAIDLAGGDEHIALEIESELPIGSGLGSSAAVSAAVIRAVRAYLGKPIVDSDELFRLTMECEKVAHGNPSGVDPATVVYTGLIAYTKGQPFERLPLKNSMSFLLVDSGKPSESTKEMLNIVAKNPQKEKIVAEVGQLSLSVKEKLLAGLPITRLLDLNGRLLEKLGVVGARAKLLSRKLRDLGYGVKITGAGGVATGSGMMLVLGNNLHVACEFLDQQRLPYFVTTIGAR